MLSQKPNEMLFVKHAQINGINADIRALPTHDESQTDVNTLRIIPVDDASEDSMLDRNDVDVDWLSTDIILDHLVAFLDWRALVQLMRTRRCLHRLLTCDYLWYRFMVHDFNLKPLLLWHNAHEHHYAFFLEKVITTAALHGHYTFAAQPPAKLLSDSFSGGQGSPRQALYKDMALLRFPIVAGGLATLGEDRNGDDTVSSSSSSSNGDVSADLDALDATCGVKTVNLRLSAASMGQMTHRIGRVQFLCKYKTEEMEVLQGSCRFSVWRRCFSLCCNSFGNDTRGPVFTVAIASVVKPWSGESVEHCAEHRGGLRLIMTPVLWDGQSAKSRISERDILAVSRPPRAGSRVEADFNSLKKKEPRVDDVG